MHADTPENAYATERNYRTYSQCSVLLGICLSGSMGLACDEPGKYLIHSENNGSPHCVAVEVLEENDLMIAVVFDDRSRYRCSPTSVVPQVFNFDPISVYGSVCLLEDIAGMK